MRLWVAGILMVAAVGLWIALEARRPPEPPPTKGEPLELELPVLGSVITPLPEGPGQTVAERTCLPCHSGDMLRQQRLNEKQWTAEITKMTGWGAALADSDRAVLLPYLMSEFGPDNDRFRPVRVRPIAP